MTGTKRTLLFLSFLCALLPAEALAQANIPQPSVKMPAPEEKSPAQEALTGMAYVEEIVLQAARLLNPQESRKCGFGENEISEFLARKIREENLPIISLINSPPIDKKKPRVYLVPEISTMELKDVSCLSYVSLTAKSAEVLAIPPIPIPRNVTVSYWDSSQMVSSSSTGHLRMVESEFEKLVLLFARDFRLAQPPALQ